MTVPSSWTLDDLIEAYTQHQRRTRGLRGAFPISRSSV